MLRKRRNPYIAREEAGSFDEGAADVKEVPESGVRQVAEGHTDSRTVSHT